MYSSSVEHKVYSDEDGFVFSMDTEKCGTASMILGAGRETKESSIDYSAGIVLHKKIGDAVRKGECIATFYSEEKGKCISAESIFKPSIVIRDQKPDIKPVVHARVTIDGVERYV